MRIIPRRNINDYYNGKEIRQTEIICLQIIDYNLNFFNCFDYLDFFLFLGIVERNEFISDKNFEEILENYNNNDGDNRNNEIENLEDIRNKDKKIEELFFEENEKLENMNFQAYKILMNFIMDLKSLEFSEIHITCAVIKIIRELNNYEKKWINLYKEIFYLDEESFEDCYNYLKS